jgi:hypothetical protein
MYTRAIVAVISVALVTGVAAASQSNTPLFTFGSIVAACLVGLGVAIFVVSHVSGRSRTR